MTLAKPSLKDSLFLGFCAVFIVFSRATMRLHLGIPGHAMFFTIFFMMTARGCVKNMFAATFTGFLAGVIAMVLGLGKSGPLMLLIFMLPGVVIDISALLLPSLFNSYLLCIIISAIAASTKFVQAIVMNAMVGMDRTVMIQHALWDAFSAVLFGTLAGIFIPPVIKKLKAFGVI
jgi:hypothetical protein